MCYRNTLIVISEDSPVTAAVAPVPRNGKPTIASMEFEQIHEHPYAYSQEDVQFHTYLQKNNIDAADPETNMEELRRQFFAKPKACFRASPLVKQYGWGIHYDEAGKIALYDAASEKYRELAETGGLTVLKGMRSKRK